MADAPAPAKPAGGAGENEGVNVQVLLRCRPLSDKEVVERTPQVISCNEVLREVTLYQNAAGKPISRTFRFDKVFSSDASQDKLYKQAIVPIVEEVMEGFNCTIFAYGQTGTGKTYTMEGGPRRSDDGKSLSAEAGVIPRSIKQIFETIEANNTDSTVKVSFLELYNEELTDLLSFDDIKDESKRLRLLEDRSGVVVQGLEEMIVKSAAEIYQVLDRGSAKRRTAETLLNKRSSRSHSVFSITIHMREVTPEGEDVVKVGKLNLVDLAGSENISRSGAKDGRAREAGSINQSLLTLGRVITALVEHLGHIPYRDSKLTRLLRESLGGKTKTCIIATIAPTVQCQEETISTLDYAHRAKNIRNRPEVNQKISKTAMIKEMSSEMEKLRMELVAQREKNGVFMSTEKYQQDEMERVQLRDTVKALREELKLEQEGAAQALEQQKAGADKAISQLESELAVTKEDLEDVNRKLLAASRTITERQYVLAAHRQAEQEVADHAAAVRSELTLAAQDLEQLFAAVEELGGVHGADREAMAAMQQHVRARVQSLTASLAGALDGQRQQLGAMNDTLAAFKDQKHKDLQQLVARVDGVQAMVGAMRDAVMTRAQEAEAVAVASLGELGATCDAHAASAVAAAGAAEAASKAALAELAQAIDKQTEQLQAFAAQQAACTAACNEQLRGAMQRLTDSFGSLQAAAGQAKAAAEQEAACTSSEMEAFAVRYQDGTARKQAELMAHMAALVQAFVEDRSSAVAQEMQSLQVAAQARGKSLAKELGAIQASAVSAVQGVQEAEACVNGAVRQLQQHTEEHTAGAGASLQSLGAQAGSLGLDMASRLQEAAAASQAFVQAASARCTQGAASVQAAVRTCVQEAESAASGSHRAHDVLRQALNDSAQADTQSADGLAQSTAALASSLTAACTEQAQGVSALGSQVDGALGERLAVGRQAVPPPQRAVQVPPASAVQDLRCAPEDKLLARCHAEFPQIFSSAHRELGSPRSGGRENDLQAQALPLAAALAAQPPSATGGGSVPPSPRSSASGLRSRIPSKPSLVASSPASLKDMAVNVTTRQQLADRTNSSSSKSILADW